MFWNSIFMSNYSLYFKYVKNSGLNNYAQNLKDFEILLAFTS